MFRIEAAILIFFGMIGAINFAVSFKKWKVGVSLIFLVVFMLSAIVGASMIPEKVKGAADQESSQKSSPSSGNSSHP